MKNRNKIIPVRVSEKEYETIKEKAEKIGLKVSTFLRLVSLKNND